MCINLSTVKKISVAPELLDILSLIQREVHNLQIPESLADCDFLLVPVVH